jgi:hypothetical protein
MTQAAHSIARAATGAVLAACVLAACVLAAFVPAAADTAQDRVRIGPGLRQNIDLPTKGPEHVLYGKIARLSGPYFTLLLRTNRLVNVDASLAVKSGTYSAPLFVGKTVMVTGKLDAIGTLHAKAVSRYMRIDRSTVPDR